MASMSDAKEKLILDHLTGKTADTSPTVNGLYIALCSVVPVDSDTGSTITELSYTGYARKQVVPADMTAASGASAETHNSVAEAFAACTVGGGTAIGWAACSATSGGTVVFWGTCTSTVISTTQTPANIAASALSYGLD